LIGLDWIGLDWIGLGGLQLVANNMRTHKFPPKKFGTSMSVSVVESRRKALQQYLDFLITGEGANEKANEMLLAFFRKQPAA
jgi:hypothetical protein